MPLAVRICYNGVMNRYNPTEIEPKWRKIWDETGVYTADLMSDKPKYIAMSMFNYPSGAGIHIGHAMNYTISDVMARYKRQQGYESYHPVGWDAFGLPAENYAIKAGVSPQDSMAKIIPSYHTQYKAMGWSNDWSKEISTHLPEYYKWTQWIFSEMYRKGWLIKTPVCSGGAPNVRRCWQTSKCWTANVGDTTRPMTPWSKKKKSNNGFSRLPTMLTNCFKLRMTWTGQMWSKPPR